MQRYIALLRGINVGGNNLIAMPQLKAAFEQEGFKDVVTYINSGNVIFSADACETELQEICQRAILQKTGLEISVAIISAAALEEALANAPDWWDADENSKHNAIFIIQPATAEQVIADAGEAKPQYESMAYYGSLIFWSAPVATFSRTRWSKISSAEVYRRITIRNANTAKKLLQLCKSEGKEKGKK